MLTLAGLALSLFGLALQRSHAALLADYQRDATAVEHGEWYRLVTALLFQDGGAAGALLNAALLLSVGVAAEWTGSRRDWIASSVSGAVVGELFGLWWAPFGAGNSVAILGLAGGLLARAFAARSPGAWASAIVGLAICLAGIVRKDLHAAAALAGFLAVLLPNLRMRAGGRAECSRL